MCFGRYIASVVSLPKRTSRRPSHVILVVASPFTGVVAKHIVTICRRFSMKANVVIVPVLLTNLIPRWLYLGYRDADICQEIKSQPRWADTPILLYTGHHIPPEYLRKSGVDLLIEKPCSPTQLVNHLRRVLATWKPKRPAPHGQKHPEPPPVPPLAKLSTVLFVDSIPALGEALKDIAGRHWNLHPLSAANMKEAIGIITAHAPDVVVTAEELCDGSGLELCRQMKQNPRWQHIRFIVWATHDIPQEQLKSAGVDCSIRPPVSPRWLISQMEESLRNEVFVSLRQNIRVLTGTKK